MQNGNPAFACAVATLLCITSLHAQESCNEHKVLKSNGHYLMCYNLTADNMGHQKNPAFQDGGQFEIRIAKEQFPIPAPHCKSNLILRMPWTDPALDNAATKVQSKRDLYNKIVSLAASSEQPLEVQLDLSPYVKEVSSEPLGLELTGCNVFFRHEAGAYVSTALSSK